MPWTTLEVTLSEDLVRRLEAVARQQEKPLNVLVQEALFIHVEDIEDGVAGYVALTEDGLDHFLTEGVAPVALDHPVHKASRQTA